MIDTEPGPLLFTKIPALPLPVPLTVAALTITSPVPAVTSIPCPALPLTSPVVAVTDTVPEPLLLNLMPVAPLTVATLMVRLPAEAPPDTETPAPSPALEPVTMPVAVTDTSPEPLASASMPTALAPLAITVPDASTVTSPVPLPTALIPAALPVTVDVAVMVSAPPLVFDTRP